MKTKIFKFLKRHRRTILLAGLVAAIITLVIPSLAFAQAAGPDKSTPQEQIISTMLTVTTQISSVFNRILWPVLLMIGGLLKNDILYSSGMETRLLAIWGQMRDLVNILFVLVLLAIAFYNVMGGSDQSFQIKTVLPKFVIALILVNFSYIGIKVALDGVNVLTTAIFALPVTVTQEKAKLPKDPATQKATCEGIYSKDHYATAWADANKADSAGMLCKADKTYTQLATDFFTNYDGRNAAIVLALNLGKISNLDDVYNAKDNLQAHDLLLNSIFSVIFYIIYTTAFVCLFVVLVARLCVLWLCIVLSPFAALLTVLPEKMKSMAGGEMNIKDQFINHAFVPIPIALVMTIGFIMLQGFKMGSSQSLNLSTSTLGVGLLASGTTTLQDIIMGVAMVAFLWKGIFAAMDKTVAKGITDKIKGAVGSVGKYVGESWQYIPFLPTGVGEGKMSVAGMEQMMSLAQQSRASQASREAQAASRELGMDTDQLATEMRDAKDPSGAKRSSAIKEKMHAAVERKIHGEDYIQQAFAQNIKNNPTSKNDFKQFWPDGTAGMTYDEFLKKAGEGNVPKDEMRRFMERATAGMPPTAATKPVPGAKGGKDAGTKGEKGKKEEGDIPKTNKIIEDNQGSVDKLSDSNKAEIEKYKAETDPVKKEAIRKSADFQRALTQLQQAGTNAAGAAAEAATKAAEEQAKAFATSAAAAITAGSATQLETAIQARRKILKQDNPNIKDKDANQQIVAELGEEGRKGAQALAAGKKIDGIDFGKPAPTAPAAAPAAPAASGQRRAATPAQPAAGGPVGVRPNTPTTPTPAAKPPPTEARPTIAPSDAATASGQKSPGGQWIFNGNDWEQI